MRNGGSVDVFSEGENMGSVFQFTMHMAIPTDSIDELDQIDAGIDEEEKVPREPDQADDLRDA